VFNDGVGRPRFSVEWWDNWWMMNLRGFEENRSWPDLNYPDIRLKRTMTEITMNLCQNDMCSAEIRTGTSRLQLEQIT
jgi:hypothetical protein